MPLSVSGWWTICWRTLNGSVATWAPASAAWVMWQRVADRGRQDLGVELVDPTISTSSRMTFMPSWLMSSSRPDERRQQARAGLRREEPLVGREDERAVGLDALSAKRRDRLQALLAHRHLDHDVRRELGEGAALGEHALDVLGDDLGADRPGVIGRSPRGSPRSSSRRPWRTASGWWSRHRGRPSARGPDLLDVGGVQEDLHGRAPVRPRIGTGFYACRRARAASRPRR